MPTKTRYLMATSCAGLFTFGIMTSFLGATLPEWSTRLSFDLERSGALFSFLYLPQIPMVFFIGPLIDRFGKKPILVAGFFCSAAALGGMAHAPSYSVLGALLVVLGLGGSAAMSAANTLIPDLYPENPSSAFNLGNIFFGVGAIFFPWVVILLTARLGLQATLWLIALLVASVAAVGLMQTFPPVRATGGFDWSVARRLAFDRTIILLAFVLFFYSALEICSAGWIRIFFEKEFQTSPQVSKMILTSFWVALMIGRLAASQVVKKIPGPKLVLGASVGAIVGLALTALVPSAPVAIAAIILCGLSYAPIFPTTAGTASTHFPHIFGTVFGMIMAFALLSGTVVPPAIGYLAQQSSIRTGLGLLTAIAVLLFLTQAIFIRHERRHLS
ncbi:MAG: MFS transporter [Terriglobia bacterium]|jgi:FHS family glucose/mannose:H+ symporter-like MFS transporter